MEALFMWVLNFILATCGYNYQITDPSVFLGSVIESHIRVEHYLREGVVLRPSETLKSFFERDDIQQAFQEASATFALSRENNERFVRIMTQQ